MLVLSRKKNEWIYINGDAIRIVIVNVTSKGDQTKVRLGIEAAADVTVHRKEVWDKIQQDAQSSTEAQS